MSIAQIIVDQAESAIRKYGTSVSIINRTSVYDETTGSTTKTENTVEAKAVLGTNIESINSYTSSGISNVVGVTFDIRAIISAASNVIAIGDGLVVGAQKYSVKRVDPIYAQDLIVTYEAYGTRE